MRFSRIRLWLACLIALTGATVMPSAHARETIDLKSDWRFKQSNAATGVEQSGFDDTAWQKVSVPYTWNRIGNTGVTRSPESNSVQGIGWYRRHFTVTKAAAGQRYFLQFDGVGNIADVWLNGQHLGQHAGAFSRFRFDATAAIHAGGDNLLVIKADNTRPAVGASTENVIPLSGDFFIYGGLYRNVSLIVTSPVHIDLLDFGGPGIYARATTITADSATVHVTRRVVAEARAQKVVVETDIQDAAGQTVAHESQTVNATGTATAVESDIKVDHPHLWNGVKDPYIYRVVVTVRSAKGEVLDTVTQPLGLRTIKFDANTGFYLNGQHLLLLGTAHHQDRPEKGWAISQADLAQDFDILQDMGANAVRLAHYQQDQFTYDLADRRGFAAWAEIPLVDAVAHDGSPANPAFTANARQQLEELIHQNYNHPSVIVWSIGNEIDLSPTQLNITARAGELLKNLNALAHAEDPSRPTTMADCCERFGGTGVNDKAGSKLAEHDQIVGLTDTIGYNRYYGWYVGKADDFGPFLDMAHAKHPTLPMAISEYGAGAGLTQHSDNALGGPIRPKGRPHPEEYQDMFHEVSWAQIKARPYIWGVFIWNSFDFSSDSRQEGDLSDVNEKGLVSFDRSVRKDAFYYYRANWNPTPTLHLVGRRYTDRAYDVVDVKAYSNADEAHLWLNDVDLGAARCADGICLWPAVHLMPGVNSLSATATINGTAVSDTLQWMFNGDVRQVRVKAGDLAGFTDRTGQRYGSDNFFSGGQGVGINPTYAGTAPLRQVSGDDPGLYDSYREGSFSYQVPVPAGHYTVAAHFAEPTFDAAGKRDFDVVINGKVVAKDVDVFALAGGKLKAVDKTFSAEAVDGQIKVAFVPHTGDAIVSALEVTPQ